MAPAVTSVLQPSNFFTLETDPAVDAVAAMLSDRAYAFFESTGFSPAKIAAYVTTPLDGLEIDIRSEATALTDIVAFSIYQASIDIGFHPEISITNAGSIRIDDIIQIGNMSQYDCLRVLPFGNLVDTIMINGSLLLGVLNDGWGNSGKGSYLHWSGIAHNDMDNSWQINGQPLDTTRPYQCAITDYLLLGKDIPRLTANKVTILSTSPAQQPDTRLALINEIGKRYPPLP